MTYPAAPWTLKGYALHTLQLVDISRVRPFVPSEVHPISVLPGKALGCVYLASYEQGSTLQYHELIVGWLARYQYNVCAWISHIYVDNEDSVAGGRKIWGLPKELAHFTWEMGDHRYISVEQNGRVICRMHFDPPRQLWPQPFLVPVVSFHGAEVLSFTGRTAASLGIAQGHLKVPMESPLSAFDMQGAVQTFHHRDLHFVAQEPRVIGRALTPPQSRVPEFSTRFE